MTAGGNLPMLMTQVASPRARSDSLARVYANVSPLLRESPAAAIRLFYAED